MTDTDKLIIKSLKAGITIRRISKETGVPERTLWARIKNNKDYQMAYNYRITFINNIFES